MNELRDKLLKLKESLAKSKKLGAVLPSLKVVTTAGKKMGNNSATASTGIAQPSKVNPVKSAEQTQNKDIKDIKMKEAQAALAIKKGEQFNTDMIKFDDKGQWSLDKSGYKGYTATDNIKRKANNTSDTTGIHTMDSIKQYGGSGPNAAGKEAAEMKRKSKKNPVKEFSAEEIAAENAKRAKK